MNVLSPVVFLILSFASLGCSSAFAWGRHDLITRIALDSSEFSKLDSVPLQPEPIELAAQDLLKRVIPELERWCFRYHQEHDRRYAWSVPKRLSEGDAREALLWALEDNRSTPLVAGKETRASEILIRYVDEPDGLLDSGLDQPPYVERVGPSMSYFRHNDGHGSGFRHYYVPKSLLPPILSPKGLAPYRADLYAHLAAGAFATGHDYWGYRFLAWSLHYVQDVTQPWHTVFLPGLSFLEFSKTEMKRVVSALHYLTEGFADSWMLQTMRAERRLASVKESKTEPKIEDHTETDPWFVSKMSEALAREAHQKAYEVATLARSFFKPILNQLSSDLKPEAPSIELGGVELNSARLDFSGAIDAEDFFSPIWGSSFTRVPERERMVRLVAEQIDAAVEGSRLLISRVSCLESDATSGSSRQPARRLCG